MIKSFAKFLVGPVVIGTALIASGAVVAQTKLLDPSKGITIALPVAEAALSEPAGAIAWKNIPPWFIFDAGDKTIPLATRLLAAVPAGSTRTIEIKAPHMSSWSNVRTLSPGRPKKQPRVHSSTSDQRHRVEPSEGDQTLPDAGPTVPVPMQPMVVPIAV